MMENGYELGRRQIQKMNKRAEFIRAFEGKTVLEVYEGSDGQVTQGLYAKLEDLGPVGVVAMNLFRAQKCSDRAKEYRRRAHKSEAYDRKNWSMGNLCMELRRHAVGLNIRWGWKEDPKQEFHKWVLYVELPQFSNPQAVWGGQSLKIGTAEYLGECLKAGEAICNFDLEIHVYSGFQVSFHAAVRMEGPDYPGDWDGSHQSAERILWWCARLLGEKPMEAQPSWSRPVAGPPVKTPVVTQEKLL